MSFQQNRKYLNLVSPLVIFCLSAFFCVESVAQDFTSNGTAQSLGGDCYQLTAAQNTQNGSVWSDVQIDLNEPFEMQFLMYFGTNDGGADGMVFVLQNEGTAVTGVGGGGVGYQTISPSVGIEFDTWQNPEQGDPFNDHIGILSNGSNSHTSITALTPAVQASLSTTNIEDGDNHFVEIIWDPETTELSVYFDCELRATSTTDIINDIFSGDNTVYFGFTGSTGGANNVQQFCLYQSVNIEEIEVAICEGGSTVLDVGGNLEGTFTWSPEDGLSDPSSPNPVATPESTTIYTVDYSDYCDNSIQANVTVHVEDLDLAIEGPNVVTCIDTQLPMLVTSNPLFDLNYQWSTEDGVMIGDYSGPEVFALTDGTYTITVDQGDACSGTFDFEVTVDNTPYEISIDAPDDIDCYGDDLILSGNSEGNDGVASWETSDGTIVSGGDTFNPVISETGTYTLTVTNPNNGCESDEDVTVDGDTTPPTVFAGVEDTISCANPTITIEGLSTSSTNFTIQWTTSNGSILEGANWVDPVIDAPGIYTATVTNSSNGCTNSDNVEIFLSDEGFADLSSMEFPNIITPNEDEFNEFLFAYLPDDPTFDVTSVMAEFSLKVFNRWGNEVYNWDGSNDLWRGQNSGGDDLGEGTYYIVLDYVIDCGNGEEGTLSGYIQLAR